MISQKTHVRYSATAGFRKKNLSRCFFCARNCVAYQYELAKCTLYRGAARSMLINADEPSLLRGALMST